jgi:nicotinate dehydrogenase subunit A
MSVQLTVNGQTLNVDVDPSTPLLYVLRNDASINSAKYGCGAGQCGACAVLMDEQVVLSCSLPVGRVKGKIKTLESYENDQTLSALNKAFIAEQAVQCGYCISGMMIRAKTLLDKNKRPTVQQIKESLQQHLCRCGTHTRIIKAIQRASQELSA